MDTLINLTDLESWLDGDDSLHCTSAAEHRCSETARWVSYAGPECSSTGAHAVLWCDGRYAKYRQELENFLCLCGLPQTHWRVVPL